MSNTKYLRELKKGDFFRLKDLDTATVYVKGEYDRSSKTYSCFKFEDVNEERFFKGSKKVFVGFTF